MPSEASRGYVYLKCIGEGTEFNPNLQTDEDEAESYTHEVNVTLDEVNSRTRIGQGDVTDIWKRKLLYLVK